MQYLYQSALLPRLYSLDIDQVRESVAEDAEDFSSNPTLLVSEALHNAAFRGNTLGIAQRLPPPPTFFFCKDKILFLI